MAVLRLARDREGEQLLPTPSEERLRLAEELAAERKARTVAEHERMVAEHARKIAERERIAADEFVARTGDMPSVLPRPRAKAW